MPFPELLSVLSQLSSGSERCSPKTCADEVNDEDEGQVWGPWLWCFYVLVLWRVGALGVRALVLCITVHSLRLFEAPNRIAYGSILRNAGIMLMPEWGRPPLERVALTGVPRP